MQMLRVAAPKYSLSLSVVLHLIIFGVVPITSLFDVNCDLEKVNFAHNNGRSSIIRSLNLQRIEREVVKTESTVKPLIKRPLKKIKKTRAIIQKASKGSVDSGQKTVMAKYLSKVRQKIVQYKYKNRLAKRLRLKGIVKLKFDLFWPNKIINIKLLEPSEYKALNLSAQESLMRVAQLPHLPKELNKKSIPITISMVFK